MSSVPPTRCGSTTRSCSRRAPTGADPWGSTGLSARNRDHEVSVPPSPLAGEVAEGGRGGFVTRGVLEPRPGLPIRDADDDRRAQRRLVAVPGAAHHGFDTIRGGGEGERA